MLRCLPRSALVRPRLGLAVAGFGSAQERLGEADLMEREREKELRRQVLQKYKGMEIPEMTSFEYGHFSTGGIQAAAAQQAMRGQGFTGFFGAENRSGGTNGGNSSGGNEDNGWSAGKNAGAPGTGVPRAFRVDWLMLFTGFALVYASGKILWNPATRSVSDLEFPLWSASLETQAKHLLFSVQFDERTREEMKREFQTVRQTNPFADFFQWVSSRNPEFCRGDRSSAETNVGTLVGVLSSTNSRDLVALASALRHSLSRRGGDAGSRVDGFMAQVLSNGALVGGLQGTFGAGRFAVPAYPPPPPSPPSPYGLEPHNEPGVHSTNPFEHVSAAETNA